jgi:hypothetical protein
VRDGFWQDLDGDSPAQIRVRGLIDLAHASGTDPRRDLVGTKTVAWGEGHVRELYSVLEEKVGPKKRAGPKEKRRVQRTGPALHCHSAV